MEIVLPAIVADVWAGGLTYWAQATLAAATAAAQIHVVFIISILHGDAGICTETTVHFSALVDVA
jgi:hypothetical protein